MKKALYGILLITVIACISACGMQSEYKAFSELLNIEIDAKAIVSDDDTHGGFHGDGSRLIVIQYEGDQIENDISDAVGWHNLPCSVNLNTFIYQPYDSNLYIPEICNGYYFFYDRHSDAKDRYSDVDLLNRGSFNFTFALYDSDTNRLYICAYDT